MSSIAVVGHIEIPPAVLEHRFVREALAIVTMFEEDEERVERVIGTPNSGKCELYGWATCIPPHVDNKGLVYLVALTDGDSFLHTEDSEARLLPGTVVRLNDFRQHWTVDERPMVCAFVGVYDDPEDEQAMQILRDGVAALARGDYQGAPRVGPGFRVLLDDEGLVCVDYCDMTVEPMLLADAKARGLEPEACAECGRPAVTLDQHWPYHQENNRCHAHRRMES